MQFYSGLQFQETIFRGEKCTYLQTEQIVLSRSVSLHNSKQRPSTVLTTAYYSTFDSLHLSEHGGTFATAGLPSLPRDALFVLTNSKENLNTKGDDARG